MAFPGASSPWRHEFLNFMVGSPQNHGFPAAAHYQSTDFFGSPLAFVRSCVGNELLKKDLSI